MKDHKFPPHAPPSPQKRVEDKVKKKKEYFLQVTPQKLFTKLVSWE
jgi:hypothetical protein